jgi:hypothetical protein
VVWGAADELVAVPDDGLATAVPASLGLADPDGLLVLVEHAVKPATHATAAAAAATVRLLIIDPPCVALLFYH